MKFFIASAIIFLVVVTCSSVTPVVANHGGAKCGERSDIFNHLISKYKEKIVSSGVDHSGNIVEILTNPETRTWTLVITKPTGETCVIAAGGAWKTQSPKYPDILV